MFNGVLEIKLEELIDSMAIDEQYALYKEYCMKNGYYDDEPFPNDEFIINEWFSHLNPFDLLNKFEGWDASWDYFVETIYGMEEWNGIEYTSDVVDAIINDWYNYENYDVGELLDLYDCELDDYIDDLYEEGMTKEEFIDIVLTSLETEYAEDFEEIMEQYEKDILEEIDFYYDC